MTQVLEHKREVNTKTLSLKFYPTDDLLNSKNFKNLRKVRCIALDKDKKVCMVSSGTKSGWMLPGGTIEKMENPILALRRELQEEADIEIKKYKLIGFLEMQSINNATGYKWSRAEMFFVANVDKIMSQTEDPAVGFVLKRAFLTIEEMVQNLNYGKIGEFIGDYLTKIK